MQRASTPGPLTQKDLEDYYKYLYPANMLCSWFGYLKDSNSTNVLLSRREFSMTLSIEGNEIYKRFLSFKNAKQFQQALIKDIPVKMDIGAIYEETLKKGGTNIPQQKEFVLDLDIDSYDNVRVCCSGASLCSECWKLMRVAAKILYRAIQEDFGFKDVLFVFSGRRGMHLWVCDERARHLSDPMRRSLMEYMYLVTGNESSNSQLADNVSIEREYFANQKKFNNRKEFKLHYQKFQLYPYVAKSIAIINQNFFTFLEKNQIFLDQRRVPVLEKILESRSKVLLENVRKRWARCKDSISMYDAITEELEVFERYPTQYKNRENPPLDKSHHFQYISFVEEEIMLTFMYPRLDINVSTSKNHLLKCPFSVHPKSTMISVPFDYESVDKFDPTTCVQLRDLLSEAQELRREDSSKYPNPEDLSKVTKGLGQSMRVLQKFVDRTLLNLKKQEDARKLEI